MEKKKKFARHFGEKKKNIVYMLWGRDAQAFEQYIPTHRNLILTSSHPVARGHNNTFLGNSLSGTCSKAILGFQFLLSLPLWKFLDSFQQSGGKPGHGPSENAIPENKRKNEVIESNKILMILPCFKFVAGVPVK